MNRVYNKVEKVLVGKTIYGIMVVTRGSEVDHINVQKLTNNPWNSLGKDFESFEAAINNYKNAMMKEYLKEIAKKYQKPEPKMILVNMKNIGLC